MFRFRLQAVETLRQNIEEQAQLKLGREQSMLQNHLDRLADYKQQRLAMLASLAEKESQKIKGSMIQFYMEAIRAKEIQIKMMENTIASQQQVVDRARNKLAAAMKQRKIVGVIHKRDYQNYLAEERKKEQNASDEMAILRHGR